MAYVKFPLSGNVTQTINPWTWVFNAQGAEFSLFNINLGVSSAPGVETEVLDSVGSYGKQLGRMGDVLSILIEHEKARSGGSGFSPDEQKKIAAFEVMLDDIKSIKKRHGRQD